ncbi:coiled-coil domain-containing protein 22 [Tanacetum coccineum]
MEESQEILLNSLSSAGVPIPPEIYSVNDLSPETLVSICGYSLRIITKSESFPVTLPESMADRFKICTDLSSALENLGFIGDISFHKFLYPSEEDMYKLIRFLVGRLSELSTNAVSPDTKFNNVNADGCIKLSIPMYLKMLQSCKRKNLNITLEAAPMVTPPEQLTHRQVTEQHAVSFSWRRKCTFRVTQLQDHIDSCNNLKKQHDLLKRAVEMASDKQTPLDSYITQLGEQIDAKRHNLAKIESKWKATIRRLEEKKHKLEEAMCAKQPDSQHKHQNWKKLEKAMVEDELSILSKEVEKLPKLATRRSYIERIKEITKNSRKQDIEHKNVELKIERELQLESNMIQERLHRTYAVGSKERPSSEQAHNLLTTIHESFEEITEKILATDRARREATDLETKLSSVAAQSLNIDKLQADLDAIRKENEYALNDD